MAPFPLRVEEAQLGGIVHRKGLEVEEAVELADLRLPLKQEAPQQRRKNQLKLCYWI